MRQMPKDGVRKQLIVPDKKRLVDRRYSREKQFCILDWYSETNSGWARNKRTYDKFEQKQLQENSSRGITPGLIDPGLGETLGNRVPLPTMYNTTYDPVTFRKKLQPWKSFPLSEEPETVPDSTALSEEDQNLESSEDDTIPTPRVDRKTPENQLLRVGKIQSAQMLPPSEYNQPNGLNSNAIRHAGEAELENKDDEDLPSNKTQRSSTHDARSGLQPGAKSNTSPIALSSGLHYKNRAEWRLLDNVNGAPRVRPQVAKRNVVNANEAEPKCEVETGSTSVVGSEAYNEDQDLDQHIRGKRRQKLPQSARLVSRLNRDDQEREKKERSPSLVVISSGDENVNSNQLQLAAASTRSIRGRKPRYHLRNRVSADHNMPRSCPSPLFFGSEDESEVDRPQRLETTHVIQARKARRNRFSYSDTDSEKFVPSAGTPSEADDEIFDVRPRAKRPRQGSLGPTERIREPSREPSIEIQVDSLDVDIKMKDMPLATTGEPISTTSAGVDHSSPKKDVVVDETRPTVHSPSHGTPNVSGNFRDTLVEEVIELRSRISSLEPRESPVSKPLGEQVDRLARIAIELRAGSKRLLDEIASLRETINQYGG